jgi:hypothetical protein
MATTRYVWEGCDGVPVCTRRLLFIHILRFLFFKFFPFWNSFNVFF